jgi:hypothetical protein
VRAILVERHRVRSAGHDICGSELDFLVPGRRRIGVTVTVEAADQLANKPRPLVRWKPEDLG